MKKLLFIINPVSGKQVLEDCLMDVLDVFDRADYEVTLHFTRSLDDLYETVKLRHTEFDTVVCCGGDGTLNLCASALYQVGSSTLLGYIPGGTTNDFANSRRINTFAPAAAEQITGGSERDVDLGILCGKPFIYVAAFGILADVSYQTSRELKTNLGYAAYLIEGIKALTTSKSYQIKVTHDKGVLEGDFIHGMVSNSKRVGGLEMPIMKNVLYDDGEMEVILVRKPHNAADTQKLLNVLVTQTPDNDTVHMFTTKDIRFESDSELNWTIDGEYGGAYSDTVIHVEEAAIKMIF